MLVHHIFQDSDNHSNFEILNIPNLDRGKVGFVTDPISSGDVMFREATKNYNWDFHNAPRKQFIALLEGAVEVETSSGKRRIFRAGDIVLATDLEGFGHKTKAHECDYYRSLFIPVSEEFDHTQYARVRMRDVPVTTASQGYTLQEHGCPLEHAKQIVVALHGRTAAADRIAHTVASIVGDLSDTCVMAPQPASREWYPKHTLSPLEENRPHLDDAFSVVDAVYELAKGHVGENSITMFGFSQGACLSLSWLKQGQAKPGAVMALSGFPAPVEGDFKQLVGREIYLSRSQQDPHANDPAFDEVIAQLEGDGVSPQIHIEMGAVHGVHDADKQKLRDILNGSKVGNVAD